MENLTFIELKANLRTRDLDTRGSKAVLLERLRNALENEGTDLNAYFNTLRPPVGPEDSVSQISHRSAGSRRSSVSSRHSIMVTRAMEAANKAGLKARASTIRKKQSKEQEEMRIRQEKEQLDIDAQISESDARERALAEFEHRIECSDASRPTSNTRRVTLNIEADPFLPENRSREALEHTCLADPLPNTDTPCFMENRGEHTDNVRKLLYTGRTTEPLRAPSHSIFAAENPERQSRPLQNGTPLNYKTLEQGKEDKLMETLVTFNLKSLMPKAEVQPFDGDFTQYRSFVRSFESIISSKLASEEEKLFYLEQYTKGKPQEIVRACLHMSPGVGYQEARRLLNKRYGDTERIAASYVNKILEWPSLKADDVEGLDQFSIMLMSCKNAVSGLSLGAREIEHPRTMRKVLEKLPFPMQDRWRRVADKILEHDYRPVSFSDLVEFIEDEARILSNPIFGRHLLNPQRDGKTKRFEEGSRIHRDRVKTTKVNCQTVTKDIVQTCLCCGKEHYTDECRVLKDRSEEDKREFITSNALCFGCLRKGHLSKDCKRRRKCNICKRMHPTALHKDLIGKSNEVVSEGIGGNTEKRTQSVQVNVKKLEVDKNSCSRMFVVPVKVKARSGHFVPTYAFLDSGSSATFCTRKLLEKLDLKDVVHTRLSVSTLYEKKNEVDSLMVTGMEICDPDENYILLLPPVYTLNEIPASQEDIIKQEDLENWPHLQSVNFPEYDVDIGLMIGNNVPQAMEPWQVIHSPHEGGPFAMKTKLGWIVSGSLMGERHAHVSVNRVKIEDVSIDQILINMYNRDFQDLNLSSTKRAPSREDTMWLKKVEESCTQRSNGHYEIALPFRKGTPDMPNNRGLALKRLEGLKKRFVKNERFFSDYKSFINDMIDKGYAEEVPDTLKDKSSEVWYIPHHGIYHPRKPDKIRVVFDCAAKFKGTSLNEALLQGPDLTNSLTDILIRFRQGQYVFVADIESMFYQVYVPDEDRDYLRFLWYTDGDLDGKVKEYRMTVHIFGANSSPSCANFALQKTAKDNTEIYPQEISQTIMKNFYVDDCLKSVDSEDRLIDVASKVKALCLEGGFKLTKFVSNSKRLLKSLEEIDRGKAVMKLDLCYDSLPMEKVLGLSWDVVSDTLSVAVNNMVRPSTKRGLLATIGAMYDPLGMIAPFLLQGRMILQNLCKLHIGWDDELPEDERKNWEAWKSSVPKLYNVFVKRCIKPPGCLVNSYQLHHFADASERGYACVSYLRVQSGEEVQCAFVFGKAHVSPLKSVTIPRLELTASAYAVKVHNLISQALDLPIHKAVFWTDSTTVLKYIRNTHSRFHTFVANRLAIIHDGSKPDQWKYVTTKLNPADDGSRGLQSERWLKGPDFLLLDEYHWPCEPSIVYNYDSDLEVKSSVKVNTVREEDTPTNRLLTYFSSWYKLVKSVAWLIQLKKLLIRKVNHTMFLTTANLNEAKKSIIQNVQREVFPEELAELKRGNCVKRNSCINRLNPVIINDLMRVGGRLKRAPIDFETKHPVILPHDHHITVLIIRECHEREGHQGREHVLCCLRQRYWIMRGNAAVRKVINKCVTCRRYQGPTMKQLMAELPPDRVSPADPPFTNSGVDCFGPFYTKRGRGQYKRYGVIFTCMAIRAIHIEIADSLSTDSFINALRRFIARRGQVQFLRCDRGTNFVGGERELREAVDSLNHAKIHETLLTKGIDWQFNPPHSSHFGGIWERQIRTIRKVMNAVMKEQVLSDDGLMTLMCEVEAIINSRPLTTVHNDSQELTPLTPNHLLTLRGNVMPTGKFGPNDTYSKKRWRHIQYLADLFWKRWKKEYLVGLQERQKWNTKHRNLAKGDVVLVVDDTAPRCHWSLGRVTDTKVSNDGLVRSATIRCGKNYIYRPLSKLIFLLENKE